MYLYVTSSFPAFWVAILFAVLSQTVISKKPHLILILADDFGWGNIGFHRLDNTKEVQTPNLDALAASGIILDRFYAYKICSPSRCALQSGRYPVHVNTLNLAPESWNPNDPVSGYAGIPRNMTCIAERLRQEGYRTIMSGKWDAGMATPTHTPLGRGYDKFLGYFHHANDYNTCGLPLTAVGEIDVCYNLFKDLWENDHPAVHLAGTAYEEELFERHSLEAIKSHDPTKQPLFLFHSFHLVHTPLQVPEDDLNLFSFVDYLNRRKYAAMVYYMDRTVGRLIKALKENQNMYDDSIILFFSDNGGPIYKPGSASNFPLRGGKYSDFEGGVRVNAFVSGGKIPQNRRGLKSADLVHVSDIYASFLRLAHYGIDANNVNPQEFGELLFDKRAEKAGLPPIDSLDILWGIITGSQYKKREEIHLSRQSLLSGKYKLIVGDQPMNIWQGEYYPNSTGMQPTFPDVDQGTFHYDCGPAGCLFDVFSDPMEYTDLALQLPEIRKQLLDRLMELNKGEFSPDRGQPSKVACKVAALNHNGFYGPFVDFDHRHKKQEQRNFPHQTVISTIE